jgi:hypothetical protein
MNFYLKLLYYLLNRNNFEKIAINVFKGKLHNRLYFIEETGSHWILKNPNGVIYKIDYSLICELLKNIGYYAN